MVLRYMVSSKLFHLFHVWCGVTSSHRSQCDSNLRVPRVYTFHRSVSSGALLSLFSVQPLSKGASRVILATENDYCKLCDASFSSPAVAQAHYQGKNHAKRLRLAEAQQNATSSWVCHTHTLPAIIHRTSFDVCGRCVFMWNFNVIWFLQWRMHPP